MRKGTICAQDIANDGMIDKLPSQANIYWCQFTSHLGPRTGCQWLNYYLSAMDLNQFFDFFGRNLKAVTEAFALKFTTV